MRSVHRTPPLGRKIHCPLPTIALSPLAATLMDPPASVANKRLTAQLSPLDATLTKNRGWGYVPVCERSEHYALEPLLLNSFVFRFLRTLFPDGALLSILFSMASALFPSRRGV